MKPGAERDHEGGSCSADTADVLHLSESKVDLASDDGYSDYVAMEEIANESKRHRFRACAGMTAFLAMAMAFMGVTSATGLLAFEGPFVGATGWARVAAMTCFLGSFGVAVFLAWPTRRLRSALWALAACSDVRAVGPLLDSVSDIKDRVTSRAIMSALARLLPSINLARARVSCPFASMSALARLLPSINASQRDLLNARQYRSLQVECDSVRLTRSIRFFGSAYADYCVAVLKALEQIGDASKLPAVRALAEQTPRNRDHARVIEAARQCLPMLMERCERDAAAQTLLRPASRFHVPESELVRPAAGPGAAGAETLLRPGTSIAEDSAACSPNP